MEGAELNVKDEVYLVVGGQLSPSAAVPLPAPEALKILTENDHVFLLWKSLAVREKGFDESRVSGGVQRGRGGPAVLKAPPSSPRATRCTCTTA